MSSSSVDLSLFSSDHFNRGRSCLTEAVWRVTSVLFFQNPLFPFYAPKRFLLRLFGAHIGAGVLIKPRVTITFPWKLFIGDHSWIGEGVWLDSLNEIQIQSNVCISQGAYLCTGNHDFRSKSFDLRTRPIMVKEGAWIAAFSMVGPGVVVSEGAVLTLGAVATENLKAGTIYAGNPAKAVGKR
jgi:putative colanic acid biosynthesis acetyltransferase WcaF